MDGQQRLTTFTLLFIFLHHQLEDHDQKGQVADLIFSLKYGKHSFNLDIPERAACMEALYKGEPPVEKDLPEPVANILARYRDIEELFPEELKGRAIPYFTDWLMENVHLVEITAYSDHDAYLIFETMNDRGLSLTPMEMLKGYFPNNILDVEHRTQAGGIWRERVEALLRLGKDEDGDAVKAWLRGQYANNIRERKRGAMPQDFDRIGSEFHRWVRENEDDLGLTISADWHERLRRAYEDFTVARKDGLECIFYNAEHNFTLQYPILLASLRVEGDEATALRKLRLVATFLDILIHRRIWNYRAIDYSTMQYAMFLLIRDVRGRDVWELQAVLRKHLEVETKSGLPSHYTDYIRRGDLRAMRLSTFGLTTLSTTKMSSAIRANSKSTALELADFSYCPRASMPAMGT